MKYKTKAKIDRYVGNAILFLLLLGAQLGLVIVLSKVFSVVR
jgi:hypothetical protein